MEIIIFKGSTAAKYSALGHEGPLVAESFQQTLNRPKHSDRFKMMGMRFKVWALWVISWKKCMCKPRTGPSLAFFNFFILFVHFWRRELESCGLKAATVICAHVNEMVDSKGTLSVFTLYCTILGADCLHTTALRGTCMVQNRSKLTTVCGSSLRNSPKSFCIMWMNAMLPTDRWKPMYFVVNKAAGGSRLWPCSFGKERSVSMATLAPTFLMKK